MVDTHAPDISDKLEALLAREQDPFTAQDILLEVVNGIRFRAFDKALMEILDKCGEIKGTSASSSSSSSSQSQSQHDNSSSSLQLREEVKKKLGSWYQQRHGVNENGNVQEMVSLIQVTSHILPYSYIRFHTRPFKCLYTLLMHSGLR